MNFYEYNVARLESRIKKIDENPDPTKLRSNRIRYEMDLEQAKEQLRAWREGKPFSEGGGFMAGMLVGAMGFAPSSFTEAAYAAPDAMRYLDLARSKGLPVDNSCDMTSVPFAMSECGELAKEDLLVCDQHGCTAMMLAGVSMKHAQGTYSFSIDCGFEENETNLKHVTDQLYELIEFTEKSFPGVIKYDEEQAHRNAGTRRGSTPVSHGDVRDAQTQAQPDRR